MERIQKTHKTKKKTANQKILRAVTLSGERERPRLRCGPQDYSRIDRQAQALQPHCTFSMLLFATHVCFRTEK